MFKLTNLIGLNTRTTFVLDVTAEQTEQELSSLLAANGWTGQRYIYVYVSARLKSDDYTVAAFRVDETQFEDGTVIKIVYNANIEGEGGNDGVTTGTDGGTALHVTSATGKDVLLMMENLSSILGGGGEGGRGEATQCIKCTTSSKGCSCGGCTAINCGGGVGGRGQGPDQAAAAGSAGSSCQDSTCTACSGGTGGAGGSWGTAGSTGSTVTGGCSSLGGSAGGSGGAAVIGDSYITWINKGTRTGSIS